MILFACILRLSLWGLPMLLFPTHSETGRTVRFSLSAEERVSHFRESPPPWVPEEKEVVFSEEDASLVAVDDDCSLRPDLQALLKQPLDWNLMEGEPAVLILHTHTTESYTKAGESYAESSAYRTLEEDYNMISIGEAVAQMLDAAGIGVIHDRQIHDYPSYNGSYVHSRSAAEEILAEYPSICLILDLHRDALEKQGRQLRTLAAVDGENAAQLMLVVGTDISRQSHKNWQENLSLALKLHALLERMYPGIMRPMNLRAQRFNQDLSPGALLVEVGAAGNTRQEALIAAKILAEGIIMLANGAKMA